MPYTYVCTQNDNSDDHIMNLCCSLRSVALLCMTSVVYSGDVVGKILTMWSKNSTRKRNITLKILMALSSPSQKGTCFCHVMVLDESLKARWCHPLSLFQLYNEVRSRREPGDVGPNAEAHSSTRFSLQSASTGSSVLTDPSDAHSSSYSDSTHLHSQRPGGGGGGGDLSGRLSNSHNSSSSSGSNSRGDGTTRRGTHSEAKVDRRAPTSAERQEIGKGIDTAELEDILQGCLGQKLDRHPSLSGQEGLLNPFSDLQSMDIRCGTDKRNTIALNAVSP